jgi:phenylacetate-coenzyme A ligase PaaK-like adenylate-forming protein
MAEPGSCFVNAITAGIEKTPLESWIARRIAASEQGFTRKDLQQYQLKALHQTLTWARQHSTFYAHRLADIPDDLPCSLADIGHLPLTSSEDITRHTAEFLCVSQDEISRVVTMHTSGTSGAPKRLFFTEEDQESALEFFAHGVSAMAVPGDRMLIALPGEREGSVGYQLARGIARAGVIPIPHGLSADAVQTLAHMEQEKATCIIGLPVQMLTLFSDDSVCARNVLQRLRFIVLCSDHVPESLVRRLRQRTGCDIFEHYGMTEMGLGGGVDCAAHMGYHLREADLYIEIVHPETGEPLPDGETGEIVFTTLHRTAIPLIRYRTGDLSRFLPGTCDCGTILKRLERVRGRVDGFVSLGRWGHISINTLDELLFEIPELLDFTATMVQSRPQRLEIRVYAPGVACAQMAVIVRDALRTLPVICNACTSGEVELSVISAQEPLSITGAKRKIEVKAEP